jgi:hypothetical protein
MSSPLISLAEALKVALNSYTGKTITRSYMVRNSQEEVQNGSWYVLIGGEEVLKRGNTDFGTLEVALLYQRGLPMHSTTQKPTRNLTFLDGCAEEVEAMVNLFRNPDDISSPNEHTGKFTMCGTYGTIEGYNFASFSNNPMFDPVILNDNHVFTSIVRLTYRG